MNPADYAIRNKVVTCFLLLMVAVGGALAYGKLGRDDVVTAVVSRARDWFADDGPASTADEPSGSDFLSPALTQAASACCRRPPAGRTCGTRRLSSAVSSASRSM